MMKLDAIIMTSKINTLFLQLLTGPLICVSWYINV